MQNIDIPICALLKISLWKTAVSLQTIRIKYKYFLEKHNPYECGWCETVNESFSQMFPCINAVVKNFSSCCI